jgi:hypothetical protein
MPGVSKSSSLSASDFDPEHKGEAV